MRILLIDNNDSFTYNLLHLIRSACPKNEIIEVCLNNNLNTDTAGKFDRIIISPGAGIPSEFPVLGRIVRLFEKEKPILGICLGHQVIAESYGATLYNLPKPAHGTASRINITDHSKIFRGLGQTITAGRYHSWQTSKENLPECLNVTAVDGQGGIMGLSHKEYNIHGIQFHPESFMTEYGGSIIRNFIYDGIY